MSILCNYEIMNKIVLSEQIYDFIYGFIAISNHFYSL